MTSNSPLSHWDAFTRWHTMLMDDTSSFYTERGTSYANELASGILGVSSRDELRAPLANALQCGGINPWHVVVRMQELGLDIHGWVRLVASVSAENHWGVEAEQPWKRLVVSEWRQYGAPDGSTLLALSRDDPYTWGLAIAGLPQQMESDEDSALMEQLLRLDHAPNRMLLASACEAIQHTADFHGYYDKWEMWKRIAPAWCERVESAFHVCLDLQGDVRNEGSIEDAFNDEAHRNLVIDGIEMMILGKVPEMVVLDYSAEALDGP